MRQSRQWRQKGGHSCHLAGHGSEDHNKAVWPEGAPAHRSTRLRSSVGTVIAWTDQRSQSSPVNRTRSPQLRTHYRIEVCMLDTIQDFLRKLGMKPHLHLVKISIFSLNNVIIRPTKIMNRANKKFVFNRGDTVSRRSPIKGVRPSPYTTLWS